MRLKQQLSGTDIQGVELCRGARRTGPQLPASTPVNKRIQRHTWLPLASLLGLLASLAPSPAPTPLLPALDPTGGERTEHFVIEWAADAPHPAAGYQGIRGLENAARRGELGLVEFHRKRVNGGWQLEQDVDFPFEHVRLMAVECLSPKSPRLVWRELTPQGGRTVFAEWTARNEQLKVYEWGQDGSLRETLDAREGAIMPQYLLELVRAGTVTSGRYGVFDPLVGDIVEWTLEVSNLPDPDAPTGEEQLTSNSALGLRQAEFRRSDGSLAGRYRFAGDDLVEFEWQEGCLRLRRITAEEYGARRQAWGLRFDPQRQSPPVKEL